MRRMHIDVFAVALMALLAAVPAAVRADDDDFKKKIKELNGVTTDAIGKNVQELAKDKTNTPKLLKQAEEMAKLDSKQFKYTGARILALTAYQLKENDIAMRFFKICEQHARDQKSATKVVEAFEGQLVLLRQAKKWEEAEELCNKVLDLEMDDLEKLKPFIMEELIEVKTRQGKVDEALKLTDVLIKADDGGWYFLRLKGWVLHQAGKSEESAKAYLLAIERLEKNDMLKPEQQEQFIDRTRYVLSNVYVELGQIDKSAEQLKILLKKKPDNATYNNDLGYIWADHDMNLDEAEKMIRKAIDEDRKARKKLLEKKEIEPEDDKDNAAYLDSLGWVLFKKKQYAEAKKPLLEAAKEKEGQVIEILDHLADVHMALGETKEAVDVWKKALDVDTENKRDLRRRGAVAKKLKEAQEKLAGKKPEEKKPEEKKPEKKDDEKKPEETKPGKRAKAQ